MVGGLFVWWSVVAKYFCCCFYEARRAFARARDLYAGVFGETPSAACDAVTAWIRKVDAVLFPPDTVYVPTNEVQWTVDRNYRTRRGDSDTSDSESDDGLGQDTPEGQTTAAKANAALQQGLDAYNRRDNLTAVKQCGLALLLFRKVHGNKWNAGAAAALDTLSSAHDQMGDTCKSCRYANERRHLMRKYSTCNLDAQGQGQGPH